MSADLSSTPPQNLCGEPNVYDCMLASEMAGWEAIVRAGGPGQYFWSAAKTCYRTTPWLSMPAQGVRFQVTQAIAVPAVDDVNTVVAAEQVPLGYDGVITSVMNIITSPFAEGSGELVWRIRLNNWWVDDFSVIQTSLGSLTCAWCLPRGGIRVYSNNWMRYYCWLRPAGSGGHPSVDPNARIICSLAGWFYPR